MFQRVTQTIGPNRQTLKYYWKLSKKELCISFESKFQISVKVTILQSKSRNSLDWGPTHSSTVWDLKLYFTEKYWRWKLCICFKLWREKLQHYLVRFMLIWGIISITTVIVLMKILQWNSWEEQWNAFKLIKHQTFSARGVIPGKMKLGGHQPLIYYRVTMKCCKRYFRRPE